MLQYFHGGNWHDTLIVGSKQHCKEKGIKMKKDISFNDAKDQIKITFKAFQKMPSAKNYLLLEKAMQDYQEMMNEISENFLQAQRNKYV